MTVEIAAAGGWDGGTGGGSHVFRSVFVLGSLGEGGWCDGEANVEAEREKRRGVCVEEGR